MIDSLTVDHVPFPAPPWLTSLLTLFLLTWGCSGGGLACDRRSMLLLAMIDTDQSVQPLFLLFRPSQQKKKHNTLTARDLAKPTRARLHCHTFSRETWRRTKCHTWSVHYARLWLVFELNLVEMTQRWLYLLLGESIWSENTLITTMDSSCQWWDIFGGRDSSVRVFSILNFHSTISLYFGQFTKIK